MASGVILPPGHAKVWAVNPGIALFADAVTVHAGDLARIEADPKTSFDAIARANLRYVTENSDFVVRVKDLSQWDPYTKSRQLAADAELREIVDSVMVPRRPGIISAVEMRGALVSAYRVFSRYNKNKLGFLNSVEPLAVELEEKRLLQWRGYIDAIGRVRAPDFRTWLLGDEIQWGVARNLIAVSRTILDLSRLGWDVYDPLHEEYAPWVNVLVKKDVFAYANRQEGGLAWDFINRLLSIEVRRVSPVRTQRVSLEELLGFRIKLKELRRLLGVQRDVWNEVASCQLERVEEELARVGRGIRAVAREISYPFWVLSLFLGLPHFAKIVGGEAAAYIIAALIGSPAIAKLGAETLERIVQLMTGPSGPGPVVAPGFITRIDGAGPALCGIEGGLSCKAPRFWTP